MRTDVFHERLPTLYDDIRTGFHPKDRRFRALIEDVPGMASENKLTLLNLAASLVPPTEAYVEIGSWKGLSIIAAMIGNDQGRFYAIESFRGFGVDPRRAAAELWSNLRRWGVADRLTLVTRNAFRALRHPGWLRESIGVLFYDGSHDRLAQYLAFGMAEPLLADEALVVIDDTSRGVVGRVTDRYVRSHPGYALLFDLESRTESDPRWWNGVRVYRYRRPPEPPRGDGFDVAWRRALYLWLYEPATWAAARLAVRLLSGRPRLLAAARRAASVLEPRVGRGRR